MSCNYRVMRSLLVASIALVGACESCKNAPNPVAPPPPPGAKKCKEPSWTTGTCRPGACGGNSPVVNSFPVGGLRPDGECNPNDGVKMLPGSMTGGKCHGATLDLDDNELVGRAGKHGKIVCRGMELKGATFSLRNWKDDEASITIKEVDQNYTSPVNHERRTAYLMVSTGDTGSLCARAPGEAFRKKLKMKSDEWSKEYEDHDPGASLLAIPVRSELYDFKGTNVPEDLDWESHRIDWLHFACVDDALAKRSLYDLYTDNIERSRAALRMLTADYCGGQPATRRGIKIDWVGIDHKTLEAAWTPEGAACLSDARLLYAGATQAVPTAPPAWFKPCTDKPCSTPKEWLDQVRACVGKGDDGEIRKAKPLCQDCPPEGCNPRELRSFIVPGP